MILLPILFFVAFHWIMRFEGPLENRRGGLSHPLHLS